MLKIFVQIGLLGIAFVFLYFPVFISLVKAWWTSDAYSHGFLVPLISLYLVWVNRDSLKSLTVQPANIRGFSLILFACFIFLLGYWSSINLLQAISLIVMISGIVLLLMGGAYLKVLSFPIAYLFFMIPYLDSVLSTKIHWPFQLFAAKIGTLLLQTLNIPVFLNAQYIELPNMMLEVAKECSGINYLTSIFAIGIPLAYLTQHTWTRKVGLVSMAVIIAILGNAIRVAFVGFWAYHYNFDPKHIHGPFHIFQGVLVAQIGFIALFVGAWLLHKIPLPASALKKRKSKELSRHYIISKKDLKKFDVSWLLAMLMLLAVGSYPYLGAPKPVPFYSDLTRIITINNWKWDNGKSEEHWPFKIKSADEQILRIYKNDSGQKMVLYIAYFEKQQQDKELFNYLTKKLHHNAEKINIATGRDKVIPINKKIIKDKKNGSKHLILFWYDLDGKIVTDLRQVLTTTLFNAVTKRHTNGSIVMISPYNEGSKKPIEVDQDQKKFIKELIFALKTRSKKS